MIPYIFFNHGKALFKQFLLSLVLIITTQVFEGWCHAVKGEPSCVHISCAGDAGGFGLAMLSGCGLEDADQIPQILSFLGQRTANF